MAKMPDHITVDVSVDTDSLASVKKVFEDIGIALTTIYEQSIKPTAEALGNALPKPKPITPEQLAAIYGVPPEMLAPDAGSSILAGLKMGTITSEIDAWDGEVLKPGECPSNGSPYVPGQLGINAMLVNSHAPSPHTWESKTPVQIWTDIQKAADAYKNMGKPMPKKTFQAKEPGEGSGIPAHAVFTSPLIHIQEQAEETAKKLLKTTGDVKVQQLDEQGNPTGTWITLGQVQDFNLESLYENQLKTENDWKQASGFPQEPKTVSVPFTLSQPPESLGSMMAKAQLKAEADAEKKLLGTYLGVDLSADSGNTVVAEEHLGNPNHGVQISVYGPNGEPIKQEVLSHQQISDLLSQVKWPSPLEVDTPWHEDWDYQDLGHEEALAEALKQKKALAKLQTKLSNHASGAAADFNGPLASGGILAPGTDHMHFEFEPDPAFAEKMLASFPHVTAQKGGVTFPKFSTTHKLAHGATLIEYPDGVSTLDLPGLVNVPGKGVQAFHGKLTLATEQARKIAGLDPLGHDDTLDATIQWAYGEPFVWHHQHGWLPKAEVSTVSTGPDQWYDEAGQPIEETLFDPEPADDGKHWEGLAIHPEQHAWCTLHDRHWADPRHQSGNLFECGSSAYTRPSTPVEDKAVLTWIRMLGETGLAAPGN